MARHSQFARAVKASAYIRYSVKSLARTPWLTLNLVLTIALGIGGNAAMAGFVRGLVAGRAPVPDARRMISLFAGDSTTGFGPVSLDDLAPLDGRGDLIETTGLIRQAPADVVVDGRSVVLSVAAVTAEAAGLLGLASGNGILVSHRVWQSELAGRSDVERVGIRIGELRGMAAGVAPEQLEGLYLGAPVDLWLPSSRVSIAAADHVTRSLWVLGRLRPTATRDQVQTLLNERRRADDMIAVLPYTGLTPDVADSMQRITTLLTIASAVVFLIACANVMTFLLGRASARVRDTSVRVALGASRRQLAMQVAADSAVIALTGGVLGLVIAGWTTRVIPSMLFTEDAERLAFAPSAAETFAVALLCLGVVVVCGLTPLFEMRHDRPARVLGRESLGPSNITRKLRAALIVTQMTGCCVLVVSSVSLVTGFRHALQTRSGQELQDAVLATFEAASLFDKPDEGRDYFQRAEAAAMATHSAFAAAWAGSPPGVAAGWQAVRAEPAHAARVEAVMDATELTQQSLREIVLPPLSGRLFSGADRPGSCPVVVVNEQAADAFFDGDAVGRTIESPEGGRAEIVGVVSTRGPAAGTRPTVYYYPEQQRLPDDRRGPTAFRVAARGSRTPAVLEANVVSASYFEMMAFTTTAGTTFPADLSPDECARGVVNQDAADRYFKGDAVGGALIDARGRRTTIVGVVSSPKVRASQRGAVSAVFLPMTQTFLPRMTLVLNTNRSDIKDLSRLREAVEGVPGGRRPPVVRTLEEHLSSVAFASERIATVLVSGCTAMALVLGILGLYGAISDASRQRRREYALRIAIGAPAWRIVRQVLGEGARLAAAGTFLGIVGSLLIRRWIAGLIPAAGPMAVWPWLAAPAALLCAVLVASAPAARRALGANPLDIMRTE